MRDGNVVVPGARLWHRDTGGLGTPIIFLHAGFGHAEYFEDHQLPLFAAAGYRAIVYDRRGHGHTRIDASGEAPVTAVDDLQAVVDDLDLDLDRFHLIGTAAGGIVATDYALTHPGRLRSMVIANSIVGVEDLDYLEVARSLRPAEFEKLPVYFKELGPEYRAANPEGVARWRDIEQRTRPAGPIARTQAPRNRITFAALETIGVPVLFIAGDADLYSPPTLLKRVAAHMSEAQFVSLRAVGHSAYWEQPDAFNRLVLDFIGRH